MPDSDKSKTPKNQNLRRSASVKHSNRNGTTKESEASTGTSHGPPLQRRPAAVAASISRGVSRLVRSQSMKEPSRNGAKSANVHNAEIKFFLIDITELRADVIICPVSSNLRHNAGIAEEVMKKAGPGLKRVLVDLRSKRLPLPVGEAFVSGSFNLGNCSHIIHVVVPRFSDYAKDEDACSLDLKKAFDNCFKQISEVKRRAPAGKGVVRSIGVPTLGAGSNKIPKDVVAQALCRSVKEFLKKSSSVVHELQCIYIVSLDEQMLSILEDAWIAEDDALSRDRKAGREGQGRSEGRQKQIGSEFRSGYSRPGDQLDSKSDTPVKGYGQSAFYPHQSAADQPSEFRANNSIFFRPSGESADQSRDRKDGALPLGGDHQDMARATSSKPATFEDNSDDEADELSATAKHRNTKDNYKSTLAPLTPAGVEDNCPICLEDLADKQPKAIPICGHKVCGECWKGLQTCNPVCPVCRKVYGTLKGNQPKNARMTSKIDPSIHLPGYDPFSTIVIDYSVPDGIQTDEHPNPGKPYKGTTRRAYLPDNREGAKIHEMLKKAFKARLIFTVGQSVTSGMDDVVTWNDIHHKTHISGPRFGYPDSSYLTRVKEELESKGIK